ncbi:MAG: DUF268 domain-containing protein [Pseudorhodoplanes sp.]
MTRALNILSLPGRYRAFARDWRHFAKQARDLSDNRFRLDWSDRMPALWENSVTTAFDAHYVYHTAWAVRMVTGIAPKKHLDISSTLYFCTTLSATIPVEFYDYRPASLTLDGLTCGRADLTKLAFASNSVESLSCMHTIEHVGLGRYGDPIDPRGDLKAAAELSRVVKPGGHLLMVTPVGKPRICFNAHRIYSFDQICAMFAAFSVVKTALVKDNRDFVCNSSKVDFDSQSYGCGCFLLRKN